MKNNICKVKLKDGIINIAMPNGDVIPEVTNVMIEQDVDEANNKIAYATIRLIVSVED